MGTSDIIDNQTIDFEYIVTSLINSYSSQTSYAYLLQGVLIFYAYIRGVGRNGDFWRIIYIGTLSSFIAALTSNICKIISDKQIENGGETNIIIFYVTIFNETLYSIRNLVLPYINVIKVKPLLGEKEKKKLRIFIIVMTVIHFLLRYNIGFWRLNHKYMEATDDTLIRYYGFATISVAFTDIVCSMIIIKKLLENYHIAARKQLKISVFKYFFQSALFILLFVDFFSLIIGVLAVVDSPMLKLAFVPLVGLNSNIILLLAFDALIFKNDVIQDMNSSYNYSYCSYRQHSNKMIPFNSVDQYGNHHQNNNQYSYDSQYYYQSNNHSECHQCSECNCSKCTTCPNNKSQCRNHSIAISEPLENTYDYVSQKN
ncbi:hypothetical protein H8356DRAFT_1625744 [Neocallimastix lanati (nom. inval.)]|jgi:hypothetical protein|nr:hypothetical protein H8356DRAFT_1625744 [Neocallimastix sp. JGI-2020a]